MYQIESEEYIKDNIYFIYCPCKPGKTSYIYLDTELYIYLDTGQKNPVDVFNQLRNNEILI